MLLVVHFVGEWRVEVAAEEKRRKSWGVCNGESTGIPLAELLGR